MPKGIKGSHSVCVVEGCDKPMAARGWCKTHYMRWRRTGDVIVVTLSVCVDCGEGIERKGGGKLATRCQRCARARRIRQTVASIRRSGGASQKAWRASHPGLVVVFWRRCQWCENQFVTRFRKGRFCSRACKEKRRGADVRAALSAEKMAMDRRCLHCGQAMPWTLRKHATFCSERCNANAHSLVRKLASRAGTGRLRVFRAELAERDGWKCSICGGQVDARLKHPDPMCPSIDHTVPLALGGTNDLSNLRLAHLNCNLRKGTKAVPLNPKEART